MPEGWMMPCAMGETGDSSIKTGALCGLCTLTRHSREKNPTEALKIFALSIQQAYQD